MSSEEEKAKKEALKKELSVQSIKSGIDVEKVSKTVKLVQTNAERNCAQSEELFYKSVDKRLVDEVKKAQNNIGNGTSVVAACETLKVLYGFDIDEMKVKTIGEGDDKKVVIACNNGVAIGKGDKFYVARPEGNIVKFQEARIYGLGLFDPDRPIDSFYREEKEIIPNKDNISVMEKNLGVMKTVYAEMGFETDLNKKLDKACNKASAYKNDLLKHHVYERNIPVFDTQMEKGAWYGDSSSEQKQSGKITAFMMKHIQANQK